MSDKGNIPLMSGFSRQRPADSGFDYGAFNTPAAPLPTTHPGKDLS